MAAKKPPQMAFQVPAELRDEFNEYCKEQDTTAARMLRAFMSAAVDAWKQSGGGRVQLFCGAEVEEEATKGRKL